MQWTAVRDSLKADEAAIEFVSFRLFDKKWTDKTYYAALVLRPGMEAPVWVPLFEEEQLAELFTLVKGSSSKDQAGVLYDGLGGAELYAAIWQPLEKELAGVKTVYYAASGLLHKVAFAAIPVTGASASGDARLGDRYNLNLVSSTREAVDRSKAETFTPASAVIYGGLQYSEDAEAMQEAARGYTRNERLASARGLNFAPPPAEESSPESLAWSYLLGTEIESREIKQELDNRHITNILFTEIAGNEESFKNLDGHKVGVIHLATHGFFLEYLKDENRDLIQRLGGSGPKSGKNPLLRSGLILSGANNAWSGKVVEGVEDGILTADEIARLNLTGTRLVVLSACQTGLGDVNNSEGVFGLQRAFKLAGAETLIMSLWEVSDNASSDLMSAFYREWLGGKSKQEAFKEAQSLVREKYPAPYYWAAFVMLD
jgi:CHAT domain-containing protein